MPYVYKYMERYTSDGGLTTLSGRTELWDVTLQESLRHPFIGHGISTPFATLSWNADKSGQSGQGHNDYISAFYQLGIVGFLTVLAIYASFLLSAIKLRSIPEFRQDSVFCLAMFIIMFVTSLTLSFPVGFIMPVTFQVILQCWMTHKAKQADFRTVKSKSILSQSTMQSIA
jgi:O-antigen ligase